MTEEQLKNKSVFRYNVSFYYQSTIIYFVAFALYLIIRGQFVEGYYTVITKDPIIYFFGIIVISSVAALIYNIYRNRYIEFNNEGIAFGDRFKSKIVRKDQIAEIKISKKGSVRFPGLKLVRLKLKNRIRPIIIRLSDYENDDELLKRFYQLKDAINKS
ncbi:MULTISPECIES: hypothetical protein [Ignavibacterium]|jgi:uncharacterized membrane protein|uniref:hypothetical protein n=1 Tax=Ignavibacterium TaxID=795750 RepID=UPI0025C1EC19|nr:MULTISPECIES: hypothetical protein [Ignavibacterium]MBI5661388.1 hypothetical protein [Ignavibacterium album]